MNIQTNTLKRRSLALAAVAALGLAACGSDDDTASGDDTDQASAADITIEDPWSRQPADGQTTSAVYGAVTNSTDGTITAVSATASVSDTVELHEVLTNDEGQMSMQEKEGGYEIAAGETFVFEPGGPHIMLLDIDAATYPATVDVTLSFDNDTTIEFVAEVREIGDAAMDMDDGEMEDGDGMVEMEDGEELEDGDHSDDGSGQMEDGETEMEEG